MNLSRVNEIKALFKKEFEEVDLSLGDNSIYDIYSILQKWLIDPAYKPVEDLKDKSVEGSFKPRPKIKTIRRFLPEWEGKIRKWERDAVFFYIKKVIPVVIEFIFRSKGYEIGYEIGRVIKGVLSKRHQDAEIQIRNELEQRLGLSEKDVQLSVKGGGYIAFCVQETEGKYMEFGGRSKTYGLVDNKTFDDFVQPTLRGYLDDNGLKDVEIVNSIGKKFFQKFARVKYSN